MTCPVRGWKPVNGPDLTFPGFSSSTHGTVSPGSPLHSRGDDIPQPLRRNVLGAGASIFYGAQGGGEDCPPSPTSIHNTTEE